MIEFTNFIQTVGNVSLDYVWLPIIFWTIIALPIALCLHRTETIPPIYQYHSRIALIVALPLGIAGSYLTEIIGEALTSTQAVSAKFIVIQNPITVSTTGSQTTLWNSLSDPVSLLGIAGIVLAVGMTYHLLKLILNMVQLKKIGRNLTFQELNKIDQLKNTAEDNLNPLIAFSDQTSIPFTYGWKNTKIVIPAELKEYPDKMAMAIRHELMHIKHRDFLLNGMLLVLKALFWFHPLIHYLHNSGQEFREIICDGQVLEDTRISKKRYAALLFELAEREYSNSNLAMSMAVNPSSLKKRIRIMATQNISITAFRSSFLLTLATAVLVVLTISCSDLNDADGITNSEFQEAQEQMEAQAERDQQPLYIINGERITKTDSSDVLSRIKGEYIKSVEVLKGEKATNEYGKAGQNGVIKIEFQDGIDKERVFSDLKEEPSPPPPTGLEGTDSNSPDTPASSPPPPEEDFYVAVEEMPELIGGLAQLQKEITYPQEAREAGDEGRVTVRFIVNEEGEVEDPQIMRGVSEPLDREAQRVVKQAQFRPGKQHGQPVRVQYALPIIFRLAGYGDDTKEQSTSAENSKKIKSENSLEEIAVVGYAEVKSPEDKQSQLKIQNL